MGQYFRMSKGTSSGLIDSPKAQSVFKHAVLSSYLRRWFQMAPRTTHGRRTFVVDGYAGPGRYLDDGTDASGARLLRAAQQADWPITCFLVERDAKTFASLRQVVAEFVASGVDATALAGDLAQHVDDIVAAAVDSPLLLFLDPCGRLQPFDTLARVLAKDRPGRWPVTEVLANLSADDIRRNGGRWLKSITPVDAQAALDFDDDDSLTLTREQTEDRTRRQGQESERNLTATLGGTWWQDIARTQVRTNTDGGWTAAVQQIANGYATRLAEAAGMQSIAIPVRRRDWHSQPIYYLVFFTRGEHGLWVFADAAGRARKPYLEAHPSGPGEMPGDGSLFETDHTAKDLVDAERHHAETLIAGNIRELAQTRPQFKPVEHTIQIYGSTLGMATETQVERALRQLVAEDVIVQVTTGKHLRDQTYRAPTA